MESCALCVEREGVNVDALFVVLVRRCQWWNWFPSWPRHGLNIPWRCRASVCLSRSARNIGITPSITCSTLARSYRRHEQHLVGVLHNMPLRIRATPARAHAANAPSWSSSFCMHAYVTLSTDARTSKTFTFTFTLTLTFTPLPVQLPAPPTLHTCTTSCINAHSAQHGA